MKKLPISHKVTDIIIFKGDLGAAILIQRYHLIKTFKHCCMGRFEHLKLQHCNYLVPLSLKAVKTSKLLGLGLKMRNLVENDSTL